MSKKRCKPSCIRVAARNSRLSRLQVEEVLQEIRKLDPTITFACQYVQAHGDIDRSRSLREMEKSDFFTREIDRLVQQGEADIAIHSAKDLPDPLAEGLHCAAWTRGLDPSDVLVLSPRPLRRIGLSSLRREEVMLRLFPHVECVDIRGTVEERMALLTTGWIDGLVTAEAALLRLGWLVPRLRLPGPVARGQGQLAILVRHEDTSLAQLFSQLDVLTTKSL